MQLDDVLVLGGGLSNALEDRGLDLSDGRRGGRRFCSLHTGDDARRVKASLRPQPYLWH